MNKNFSNILKIALTYTTTVLGAGFISGKELMSFFVCYGSLGLFGVCISGVLFSLVAYSVMKIIYQNKIEGYKSFSNFVFGKRWAFIFQIVTCAFLLVIFSAMISAGGQVFFDVFNFGFSRFFWCIIFGLICLITLFTEVNGFVKINTLLGPFIIVGGIIIGVLIFFDFGKTPQIDFFIFEETHNVSFNFVLSAVIYTAYNIITAIAVIISLKKFIKSKCVMNFSGGVGGIMIGILGIAMSLPIFKNYNNLLNSSMPIFDMVKQCQFLKWVYIVILIISIFTTAIASLFSLINNFQKTKENSFIKVFLVIWGILMAQIGFSNFVELVYPFFGLFGFLQIILILYKAFKLNKKVE